jgi:hypothetical protein
MSNYLFLPYQSHHVFYLSPYNLTLTLLIDGLDSTPEHLEIVLDKAALEQFYLGVFWFFRVVTIPTMLQAYYNITTIM